MGILKSIEGRDRFRHKLFGRNGRLIPSIFLIRKFILTKQFKDLFKLDMITIGLMAVTFSKCIKHKHCNIIKAIEIMESNQHSGRR
tara:strand:+ start:1093 stop:1350 length:258 start_codon:yes stop_codon:yes gene_type:complete